MTPNNIGHKYITIATNAFARATFPLAYHVQVKGWNVANVLAN